MDNKQLEEKVDRIETKIDTINDTLNEHKIILTKQNLLFDQQALQLSEHIRRSDSLENYLQLLETKMEDEMAPLKKHIIMVDSIIKFLGALAICVGAVVGVLQIFKII